MKKTIVAVAALAFALGAFADGVPSVSWFTATPGNLDDGAWTLTPTATEPLVENDVWVVDTETPGTDDAIYTPKGLWTDNKAEKKTRMKLNIAFGAAYKADELPTVPTDAQTGLVLGIDEGVTYFYGLVSGGWTKLKGGVPADLDTAVDVTVEINYEENPVTLSFKVGNAVLEDADGNTTFQRYAGTDATSLASVGFAGSGKIKSIAGDADPKYVVDGTGYLTFEGAMEAAGSTKAIELYYNTAYTFPTDGNYTLMIKPTGSYAFTPTFGDGSFSKVGDPVGGVVTYNAWKKVSVTIPAAEGAEVKVAATESGNDPIEGTDGAYTVALGDKITATYEATAGNVISGGKETKKVIEIASAKDGDSIADQVPTFVVGKAKYNGELYDTVQHAVNAAEANSEIVIVADSTDPVSIGKAVTFTGNADYVVGAITLTEGGKLTIEKGKYDVLNPVTTDNLVLTGGFFTDKAEELQAYCSLGYFAQAIGETGYKTAVKAGEIVTPDPSSEVPAIAVEPGFFPQGTEDKVAYLEEKQTNDQPRWVNYALGLNGEDPENKVELADKGDADTISIDLAAGALKAGTGLTAKYETGDGEKFDSEITLDDETTETGVGTIRLVLTDANGNDFVVKEVDYGLKKEVPTTGLSVISVPFTELGGENGLPLDKVLKLKNIASGDKIYRYDANVGANVEWTLRDGEWVGETAPIVKPGEGLWLERKDNTTPVYFFGGFQTAKAATPVAANNWALVANPSLTETLPLEKIIPSPTPDMQVTIETGAEPKIFTYENGVWGYNKKETSKRTVGKREVTVSTVTRVTDKSVIGPGQGFWFANGAVGATDLNWNND